VAFPPQQPGPLGPSPPFGLSGRPNAAPSGPQGTPPKENRVALVLTLLLGAVLVLGGGGCIVWAINRANTIVAGDCVGFPQRNPESTEKADCGSPESSAKVIKIGRVRAAAGTRHLHR
jgi:hypothetical protein